MSGRAGPSKGETLASVAVLVALVGVAAGVYLKQSDYDPAIYRATAPGPQGERIDPARFAPPALTPAGKSETFDTETLYVKINGKAGAYHSAGFERLDCRRFAPPGRDQPWMEAFVYRMASPEAAFSVFSSQRRPEGRPLELPSPSEAYTTENAVYLVHGTYYVELVASEADPDLRSAMAEFAANFARDMPGKSGAIDEANLFPGEHRVPGSVSLMPGDQVGFEPLGDVFTAIYELKQGRVVAFLSRRKDPAGAAELANAYFDFLLRTGWQEASPPAGLPKGARLASLLGTCRLVFARGPYVAGVHEAESVEAAAELAARLSASLEEVRP